MTELGIDLPAPFPPAGEYVNAVRTGDLLILGGHVPFSPPETIVLGKLGADLDVEDGRRAARYAAISALATIRSMLGSSRRGEADRPGARGRQRRTGLHRPHPGD